MHATIDVRLTVSIDDDKTIPLATLAEFITDQNIESVLLEGLVESLDAGTSNPVERLMGEVSKRCKNQGMRWAAEGLEALLQLRLVKYADPEHYQAFLDELLHRSTPRAMSCDLSIESTRGKL